MWEVLNQNPTHHDDRDKAEKSHSTGYWLKLSFYTRLIFGFHSQCNRSVGIEWNVHGLRFTRESSGKWPHLATVRIKWDNVYKTLTSTAPNSLKENHLENVHLSQLSLTSGYRIRQEVIVLVIQQIFTECLLCATQCLSTGEIKSSVCTPGPNKNLPLLCFFSLVLTSLRRRLVPGMRSTLIPGPLYFLLCPHIQANRVHISQPQTVSLCVQQKWSSEWAVLVQSTISSEGGMWFFLKGNLKWIEGLSLQPASNYYLGLKHSDNCLNLWKHKGSKHLPSETKVSINSRPTLSTYF